MPPAHLDISPGDHAAYMAHALSLARLSPRLPTNFRVGAVLVSAAPPGRILSTGYTLELPGNTHAEQVCFMKLASAAAAAEHGLAADGGDVADALPAEGALLYTTVEPCVRRLSGNKACVDRIVETRRKGAAGGGVKIVYVGVKEPETFVGENKGARVLEEAAVSVVLVEGMEEEILEVATEGHKKEEKKEEGEEGGGAELPAQVESAKREEP